ncbi:CPBP family intramembrane metalloprotease [Bacillus sp. HMF5848]|uniref:CPBP family intramembrane glutamic endopeptidase n=1 Tax=Bacillus sp. HMF5848 TaxID=2495421 RepID=UPI000F792A77|nr:type II CAAX endopeptidase family protein [Bacillus sp. HMF5848]RSK27201.1 CPBP family intramembrane metalloprotease [Bacillus sp. HMF5848]
MKRLLLFFSITFAISWISWGSLIGLVNADVVSFGDSIYMILFLVGGFGPTISPFLSIVFTKSDGNFREYFSRLFQWKLHPIWYFIIFTLPVVVTFSIYQTLRIFDSTANTQLQPWYMFFPLLLSMIFLGGLEELGWRGVALPVLLQKYNVWTTNVILAIVWAVWHLPLFFLNGTSQNEANFWLFGLSVYGFTTILTWLYRETNSILVCVLLHAAINASFGMGYITLQTNLEMAVYAGIMTVIGVVVSIYSNNKIKANVAM